MNLSRMDPSVHPDSVKWPLRRGGQATRKRLDRTTGAIVLEENLRGALATRLDLLHTVASARPPHGFSWQKSHSNDKDPSLGARDQAEASQGSTVRHNSVSTEEAEGSPLHPLPPMQPPHGDTSTRLGFATPWSPDASSLNRPTVMAAANGNSSDR